MKFYESFHPPPPFLQLLKCKYFLPQLISHLRIPFPLLSSPQCNADRSHRLKLLGSMHSQDCWTPQTLQTNILLSFQKLCKQSPQCLVNFWSIFQHVMQAIVSNWVMSNYGRMDKAILGVGLFTFSWFRFPVSDWKNYFILYIGHVYCKI